MKAIKKRRPMAVFKKLKSFCNLIISARSVIDLVSTDAAILAATTGMPLLEDVTVTFPAPSPSTTTTLAALQAAIDGCLRFVAGIASGVRVMPLCAMHQLTGYKGCIKMKPDMLRSTGWQIRGSPSCNM